MSGISHGSHRRTVVQAIETSGPGGAERVLFLLTLGLAKRGYRTEVILLKEGWLADTLRQAAVEPIIVALQRSVDRSFLDRLIGHLRRLEADVIHSHEFGLALYGALAARRLGIRHVATAHGNNFIGGCKRRLAGATVVRGSNNTQLVAVSDALAGKLARNLWFPRHRVATVPNGIALPTLAPTLRRPGEPLRLLAVGNLYPLKNHALLVEAVGKLKERGIDARLDILGRGDTRDSLERQITELRLAPYVTLHGFREDVGAFVSRSHVLVSASLSEGMPLSFLEAMAAGLPVVATQVGGVPELVEDGQHGLLYESGDVEGLVQALSVLAFDELQRQHLGSQAARFVRERYSEERMISAYEKLYQKGEGPC